MPNVFYVHFSTDDICRPTDDFHGTCSQSTMLLLSTFKLYDDVILFSCGDKLAGRPVLLMFLFKIALGTQIIIQKKMAMAVKRCLHFSGHTEKELSYDAASEPLRNY